MKVCKKITVAKTVLNKIKKIANEKHEKLLDTKKELLMYRFTVQE
jgi:hypothetical protein